MKRLSFIMVIVVFLACFGLAMASEKTLNGETFCVVQGNVLYELTFFQGPYGPGEAGTATLTAPGMIGVDFSYQFNDPFCLIGDTLRFALIGVELMYIPQGTLTFVQEVTGDE